MRYLFVTVDGAGALIPQIALAQRVAARGHKVRFLCCRSQRDAIESAGLEACVYSGPPDFDMADARDPVNAGEPDGADAVTRYCDIIWFGPAAAVAADVVAEARREPTDAIVIDYFAYGAAIAAEHLGIPSAIVWHTTRVEWDVFDVLGLDRINAARTAFGLAADASIYDAYHRAPRVLVLTTERFVGNPAVASNTRYVGPQLPPGYEPTTASRPEGRPPQVLVCVGTSYQRQGDLLRRIVTALGDLPVHGLVGTGRAVALSEDSPANVSVRPWIDHCAVLPETDLVVSHCGLGTIMTSSAFGVPLVGLPLGRDQHRNADHAASLGIARIGDPAAGVDELRSMIWAALKDDALSQRAAAVAAALSGGYDLGAQELETLA